MSCPKCGSNDTYYYNIDDDVDDRNHDMEQCAECGTVFDIFCAGEDDDENN